MMKKIITNIFAKLALVAGLAIAFEGYATAQTTVTQTNFSAISGNVNNDSKVSFDAYRGNGTSNAAANSGAIRLYQNANGLTGGYVVIGVAEGYEITSATIKSTMATTTGYKLSSSDPGSTTPAKNTFDVSNYSLSANTDYTVNNISTQYITFACFGTSSSSRLYLSKISVTYKATSGGSLSANDLTLNATSKSFDLKDGDNQTFQLTNSGSADGALSYESSNENVATVSSEGLITALSEGSATITVTQAQTATYYGGTATCSVTVTDSRYSVSDLTFTAACGGSGTADDGAEWTVTSDANESTFADDGIHYGTNSANVTYVQLSTSDISGTIRKVVVKARDAQAKATISVTVGGVAFTCSGSATATNTSADYTFTGSGNGEIIVRIDRGSSMSKAIYVKSVKVSYSAGPSISADSVNIAYNATSSSFDFTVNNPAVGGTTTVTENVDWISDAVISGSSVTFTTTANEDATPRSGDITLTYTYDSNKTVTKTVTITQDGAPVPSISATDVNILYDATEGNIAYTVENSVNGGSISAAVTTGDWVTLDQGTTSPISFTCPANSETTARTAAVTITYTYNTNQTVTKDVTITQAAAPVIYSTIPAVFDAATSSETEVHVTFNNWVVSGVSTNGKNVFVTDNSGNGFVIYSSSDQSSTYSVGKILSGTDVTCSLKKNTGYAQITNLDSSKLTITDGGSVTTSEIALASLSGVNTGALVSYEGLTCSIDNTKYYLSDGTTTIQLYNSLHAFSALENGKKYNITGIFQQYNSTKEILPRSAADIEVVVVVTPTITVSPATITELNYVTGNGPSAVKSFTVSGENLSANINLTLGDSDFEMCLTENGTYTNSLSITQSGGTVSATTVFVRLKADKTVDDYSGTVTISSTDAADKTVSLSGTVSAPEAPNVTWDLTTNNFSAASVTQVSWTSSYVNMTLYKNTSSTAANNYLGGNSTNDHTRLYQNQALSISPVTGYEIDSIEISAIASYVAGFTGNTWTNGKASTSGTKITITPTDGTKGVSVVISAACRATAIKVYYSVNSTPSIVVSPSVVNTTASAVDGTLDIAYLNLAISDKDDFDIEFCDENGTALDDNPTWIMAEVSGKDSEYVVSFILDSNTGAERTAYFKVYAFDGDLNEVYSNLITITQEAPDYAELPFSFTGDLNDIDGTAGLNQDGLGSYSDSGSKLKFDDAGDYLILSFNEAPGTLSFNIKGNGFSGGTFKVQTSVDGVHYTDLAVYTELASSNTLLSFSNLAFNVRYIKWIYAERSNGNVGIGNISLEQANANEFNITATANGGRFWATFYNEDNRYDLPEGAQAFTLDSEYKLYRLGDGKVIPQGVAVIIIADKANITLKKSDKTGVVAVSGKDNESILLGSDSPIAKESGKLYYVLGIKDNIVGFYKYNGAKLPAGKAYYTVNVSE